jgi:hypothetical protein
LYRRLNWKDGMRGIQDMRGGKSVAYHTYDPG